MDDLKFVRWLAALANANIKQLDGTTGPIKKMFTSGEIVVGVWQDAREQYGVGYLALKGGKLLRECVANGGDIAARIVAIPCQDYEHAVAAREVFGELDLDA